MNILILSGNRFDKPGSELRVQKGTQMLHAIFGNDKNYFFCDNSAIEIQNNGEVVLTNNGEKLEKPDLFWPLVASSDGLTIEHMLLDAGIECLLNLRELQVVGSKIATYQRLAQYGIRVPDSVVFFLNTDRQMLIDRFGFPFVVKPDTGLGGQGVELIHNKEELDAYFDKMKNGEIYVAQEYIKTSRGRDIRVVILHGKYFYSMERCATNPDEFRSNVHVGGVSRSYELSEDDKHFCEKVASVIDLPIMGLDLMIGDGEYVLAEINGFPGMPLEKMKEAYPSVLDKYLEEREC